MMSLYIPLLFFLFLVGRWNCRLPSSGLAVPAEWVTEMLGRKATRKTFRAGLGRMGLANLSNFVRELDCRTIRPLTAFANAKARRLASTNASVEISRTESNAVGTCSVSTITLVFLSLAAWPSCQAVSHTAADKDTRLTGNEYAANQRPVIGSLVQSASFLARPSSAFLFSSFSYWFWR